MEYEHVYQWVKTVNLISNRVSCINNLIANPDGSFPCHIVFKRGVYRVLLSGAEFARYRVYDDVSARAALDRVTTLLDGLWLARRGCVAFTT